MVNISSAVFTPYEQSLSLACSILPFSTEAGDNLVPEPLIPLSRGTVNMMLSANPEYLKILIPFLLRMRLAAYPFQYVPTFSFVIYI